MSAQDTTDFYPMRGKVADPAFRTERARKAALASHKSAALVTRFVKALPKLTPEQIETIRRALPPVTALTADASGGRRADG